MKLRQKRGSRGFTLIELLIVVIVIGILATLALPQFSKAMERARQAEARNVLGALLQAEKIYYAERNAYTASLGDLLVSIPDNDDRFFDYAATTTGTNNLVITATRKTTTPPTPTYTGSYTITLNLSGLYETQAL